MQQKAISEDRSSVRPQDHALFVGHDHEASVLLRAMQSKQMPHAWLLTGQKGIGKATLAYRFARMALIGGSDMDIPLEHPVSRKISQGCHPDLLVIEKKIQEKTQKADAEIKVEQVREVSGFLAYTAASSPYRVIIVDSADDLNPNAANALLKSLEEPPPQTVFLLINHRSEAILPTIASRCVRLRMHPLSPEQTQTVLAYILPDVTPEGRAALARYANGSPGMAVVLQEGKWEIWLKDSILLLQQWPKLPMQMVHLFIDRVLAAKSDEVFKLVLYLLYMLLSRVVSSGLGIPVNAMVQDDALLQHPRLKAKAMALMPVVQHIGRMLTDSKVIHAEKRTVLISLFEQLQKI